MYETNNHNGSYLSIHFKFRPIHISKLNILTIKTLSRLEITLESSIKEGQHLYEFIKVGGDDGIWKIRRMISSPTFSAEDKIISVDQISPAKKPMNPMIFDLLIFPFSCD